jgi:hypothetical protein
MPIIPGQDPNEAYDVVPMKEDVHWPRGGWWTVTCNGISVYHFTPERREEAERYASDPQYRLSLVTRKLHER